MGTFNVMAQHQNQKRSNVRVLLIGIAIMLGLVSACVYFLDDQPMKTSLSSLAISVNETPVPASFTGVISICYVQNGQIVEAGEPLFTFDGTELAGVLAKEREMLVEYELLVPPEKLSLFTEDADDKDEDISLEVHLKKLKDAEEKAKGLVERTALDVSQKSIALHKVKENAEKKALLQETLTIARNNLEAAKKAFEKVSLQRSSVEADIRHIRQQQAQTGISAIPEKQRIARYQAQLAKVRAIKAKIKQLTVLAPAYGQVCALSAFSGKHVTSEDVLAVIRTIGQSQTFSGTTNASWVTEGCAAQVTVLVEGKEITLTGKVSLVISLAGEEESREEKKVKELYFVTIIAPLPESLQEKMQNEIAIELRSIEVFST